MSANQLDDDFDGPAQVADKKPTRDDILGVLKWSAPREVQTKIGPRLVSSADANEMVFALFRDEKDSIKSAGYSLGEFKGKWHGNIVGSCPTNSSSASNSRRTKRHDHHSRNLLILQSSRRI